MGCKAFGEELGRDRAAGQRQPYNYTFATQSGDLFQMRNRTLLVNPPPKEVTVYDRPSKSQLKRDSTAMQELGREVADLSRERITQLNLPEKLFDAFIAYQKITAREGGRRQLQYLGRLMRDVDPAPIREALDKFNGASKAEVTQMHLAERWRERLLDDSAALTEFAQRYAPADITRLRTLIRNAKKENLENRPPRDYRDLYREIRAAMDALPATPADEPTT